MTTPFTRENPFDLFEPTADARRSWWQRRGAFVGSAIVLVVVVIAAFATGALGSSGPSFRTAVVTERAVDAQITSVGTIEPVSQAAVGFPASGTVKSVAVKVGDTVAAGDTLAQLDTKALEQELHDAEAALAEAELTLENGLAGQKATTSPGGGSSATARNVSSTSGSSETRIVFAAASTDPELQAAQQAVLQAQQQVDAALVAASTAYDNAVAVCSAQNVDPVGCQDALEASLDTQKDVQTAQNQLVEASVAYDDLLAERAAQAGSGATPDGGGGSSGAGSPTGSGGTGPDTGSTGPDTGSIGSIGDGSAPSGGGPVGAATQAPSSADLIAYQKAVDAAAAQVAVSEQALQQATITTPIAGTVVAVNLAVGASVSDASSENVVVQGDGGLEATTTVGVDDIATVEVGQRAFVNPDGTDEELRGSVAAISVAPVSSGSTSYRVTIALDDPDVDLHNGSSGTVSIVTEQSERGLAVPTSAVQATNGRYLVTVVDGGDTRQVAVEVGVIGREWTSIASGVSAGDEVVVANLDEPLPSSATTSSGDNTGSASFPGGGGPPTFLGGPGR